jgi:hypothetical protein
MNVARATQLLVCDWSIIIPWKVTEATFVHG